MRKLIYLLFFMIVTCSSCRKMNSSFSERKASVLKVLPKASFVYSEGYYYAVDTVKQPNVIYRVYFKAGGIFYTASDIDLLIRIN